MKKSLKIGMLGASIALALFATSVTIVDEASDTRDTGQKDRGIVFSAAKYSQEVPVVRHYDDYDVPTMLLPIKAKVSVKQMPVPQLVLAKLFREVEPACNSPGRYRRRC